MSVSLIISLVLIAVSLTGGGLLLVTIVKHRSLWTPSHLLILAVVVTDMINAIAIIGFLEPVRIVLTATEMGCLGLLSLPNIQTQIAAWLLLLVGMERYLAIIHPLHYPAWVTPLRIGAAVGLAVVMGTVLGLCPVLGWNNISLRHQLNLTWVPLACMPQQILRGDYLGFSGAIGAIRISLILVIYGRIMCVARAQARQIHALSVGGQTTEGSDATRRQYRGLIILICLVFLHLLSSVPTNVMFAIEFDFFTKQSAFRLKFSPGVYKFVNRFALVNMMADSYLYGFGNKTIRTKLLALWTCWCRRQPKIHNSTTVNTVSTGFIMASTELPQESSQGTPLQTPI